MRLVNGVTPNDCFLYYMSTAFDEMPCAHSFPPSPGFVLATISSMSRSGLSLVEKAAKEAETKAKGAAAAVGSAAGMSSVGASTSAGAAGPGEEVAMTSTRGLERSKLEERAKHSTKAKFELLREQFKETLVYEAMVLLRDYVIIIFIGAVVFRFHEKEGHLQDKNADTDMTWIDSLFFATVCATTVGYGHIIAPQSFGGKLFSCFYFLGSAACEYRPPPPPPPPPRRQEAAGSVGNGGEEER